MPGTTSNATSASLVPAFFGSAAIARARIDQKQAGVVFGLRVAEVP